MYDCLVTVTLAGMVFAFLRVTLFAVVWRESHELAVAV